MDRPEKRVDLNSELGMSRRDLLRRSAIVGGTLLWVAPAIESIAPKAFAQTLAPSPSPGCAACYCWNTRPGTGLLNHDTALHGGIHSGGLLNADDCASYCANNTDQNGDPFTHSVYCSGTSECQAIARDDLDSTLPSTVSCPGGTVVRHTGPNNNYGVICCVTA